MVAINLSYIVQAHLEEGMPYFEPGVNVVPSLFFPELAVSGTIEEVIQILRKEDRRCTELIRDAIEGQFPKDALALDELFYLSHLDNTSQREHPRSLLLYSILKADYQFIPLIQFIKSLNREIRKVDPNIGVVIALPAILGCTTEEDNKILTIAVGINDYNITGHKHIIPYINSDSTPNTPNIVFE